MTLSPRLQAQLGLGAASLVLLGSVAVLLAGAADRASPQSTGAPTMVATVTASLSPAPVVRR